MKNLLVTLLSDQTIPNVQFIKEKGSENTHFLFVSTDKMEAKGVKNWIMDVCDISIDKITTIVVDQFSLSDIEKKLNELNYDEYDKLMVNVTGGTKIMSHVVTEFFKKFAAEIFYLTGIGNIILQVHPKTKQLVKTIHNQITLKEYMSSHGFQMKEGKLSGIPFEYTKRFFELFLANENCYLPILLILRGLRADGKKTYPINSNDGLSDFLAGIEFPLSDKNQQSISRSEIKYLTGEWFEEYIYFRLKQELNISEENIQVGIELSKSNTVNEFDVVFLYNGNLYTIECKTSIINEDNNLMLETIYKVTAECKTSIINEDNNLMLETIYKVTALQKNLGLFSKSSIFTLSSKENKEVKKSHLERGKLFNIDVFCREDILFCESVSQLLKIIPC